MPSYVIISFLFFSIADSYFWNVWISVSSHFLGIQKFFNIVKTMLNKTLVIASFFFFFFSFNEFQKISWGGTAPPPYTSASVLWWKKYNSGFLPLFTDTTLSMPTVLSKPPPSLSDPLRERLLGDGRSQRSNSLSNQNFQAKLTLQITRDPVLDRSTGHGFTLTTNAPLLVRDVAPGTCSARWLLVKRGNVRIVVCVVLCCEEAVWGSFYGEGSNFGGEVGAEIRLRLGFGFGWTKECKMNGCQQEVCMRFCSSFFSGWLNSKKFKNTFLVRQEAI